MITVLFYSLLGTALVGFVQPWGEDVRAAGAAECAESPSVAGREPVVQSALDLMRSGTITRLEIIHLPAEIMTYIRVGPEDLEEICFYRISMQELYVCQAWEELISAVESSPIRRTTFETDCRWGCIFYDAENNRVLTMYFGQYGKNGFIDGTPVTSVGPIVKLLERRCSSLWE